MTKLPRLIAFLALTLALSPASADTAVGEEAAPPLAPVLEKLKAAFEAEAPADVKETLSRGIASVAASGITEKATNVGDQAPDFTLKNAVGDEVKLSAMLKNGAVVLTYYRGGWCPYCNATLRAYEDALDKINAAGGQLVALTPELPDKSLSTKEKQELSYEILSDVGQAVARSYGVVTKLSPEEVKIYKELVDLRKYNGEDAAEDELPLAATYIIDSSGTVRWAFLDADYRKRAEPSAIVNALKNLEKPAGGE